MTTTDDFLAGQKLRASDLLRMPRGIVARGRRLTDSTATTATTIATGQGVQRVSAVVYSGRLYRVHAPNLGVASTVANDRVGYAFTYTTDGTTPTAASTVLVQGNHDTTAASITQDTGGLETHYVPASDQTLTVLLVAYRQAGTGSVVVEGSTDWPCDIVITDLGVDTGDVGVDV